MPFLPRTAKLRGSTTRYRIFVPDGLSEPAPVILFLHGAGEGGTDGVAPTTVGIGPAIVRAPERFPALVLFPQSPRGVPWHDASLDAAELALAQTLAEFRCDAARLYLTGISMGGYGTWALALRDPTRFAALVPICGGLGAATPGAHAHAASSLAHVPIWVFHGDADTIIPVSQSRLMVEALRAAGGQVRYTEYPGVGHNSWDRAYGEPELLPWTLAQRRP